MPPKGAKKDDVVLRTYQRRVRNAQRKVTEANENIKRLKSTSSEAVIRHPDPF